VPIVSKKVRQHRGEHEQEERRRQGAVKSCMTAIPPPADGLERCPEGAEVERREPASGREMGHVEEQRRHGGDRMPHRMSPFTLNAMNAMIAIRPMRVTQTSGFEKSPSATSVAGLPMTILSRPGR